MGRRSVELRLRGAWRVAAPRRECLKEKVCRDRWVGWLRYS